MEYHTKPRPQSSCSNDTVFLNLQKWDPCQLVPQNISPTMEQSYRPQALIVPAVQFSQSSEVRTHAPQTSKVYALPKKAMKASITYTTRSLDSCFIEIMLLSKLRRAIYLVKPVQVHLLSHSYVT